MSTIVAKASIELRASPKKVWPLLGNTEQVNRYMGQAPFRLRPVDRGNKSTARFLVESREALFSMDHEALPLEWEEEKYLKAVRKMVASPFRTITLRVNLEPGKREGGTRVDVTLEVETRTRLANPFARIAANRYVERYEALAREVDAHVEDDSVTPYKMAKPVRLDAAQVSAKRLAASGIDSSLAEKLATFVTDAPDVDVIHMRPFDVADRWERDRIEVLRAFLYSVQAGLTELRWSIICPSCRTASENVASLEEISREGHCQMCDISFDLELDKSVEATFVPHEAVRPVVTAQFCIGGPSRVPHVIAQANLDPGTTHVFTVPAEIGRYRIFARGGAVASIEVADGGSKDASATLRGEAIEPSELRVAPAGKISLRNASDEGRHAKLERLGYASAAATAHVVSTLPEFRRFFSKDLLKRETPLKVSHVAILFSDLVGSTALYTHVGDATAFRIVDDHFDLLREIVGQHDGVVVKTMGDAILAAFTDETKATAAAADALVQFEEFRKKREHGDRIGIKLGLYAGACYVVSANGVLDYFGQVVNVASRVQHLAGSGEVLLPQDVYDALDASVRDRLVVVEKLEATVKGVANPIPLVRTRLLEKNRAVSPSTSSRSDAEAQQPRS